MHSRPKLHILTKYEYRLAAWLLAFLLCAPLLVVSESQSKENRNVDFIYFYVAGQTLERFHADRLYDISLQQSLCQAVHPFTGGTARYGYFSYPPFIAAVFLPFARLPFWTAFRVWQIAVALVYVLCTVYLVRRFVSEALVWFVLPLALSFCPFVAATFINGQCSIIGYAGISLALAAYESRKSFRAGLALSLCAYKPPLLILLVPMLLVGKRVRVLLGVALGVATLFLASGILLGWKVWVSYWRFLPSFRKMQVLRPLDMYTDLIAFFSLLVTPAQATVLSITCAALVLAVLTVCWGRAVRQDSSVWAITVTWTLLLNFYVPIYDTILLVPSVLASGRLLGSSHATLGALSVAFLFAASWVTLLLVTTTHIQLLTVAIAVFGAVQLTGYFTSGAQPSETKHY